MPKLFVGNIPHVISHLELQEWVESRGFHVEAAEIIYDRHTLKSRGFGFVTLDEKTNPQTAISMLNGQQMDGRIITVNEATPPHSLAANFKGTEEQEPFQKHG
jgi:RNA recognition motif-containing protein